MTHIVSAVVLGMLRRTNIAVERCFIGLESQIRKLYQGSDNYSTARMPRQLAGTSDFTRYP